MNNHDFRIEEELHRLLFVEGGAYHKKQLANKLGISESYLDKIISDYKEI